LRMNYQSSYVNPDDSASREIQNSNEMMDLIGAKPQRLSKKEAGENLQETKVPLLESEATDAVHNSLGELPSQKRRGLLKGIYYFFAKEPVSTQDRIITFDRNVYPTNRAKNIIRNQKYSILTFLPLVLYHQFKFFFNFFFLVIALSQFIPILKVGLLFTYVAPLVFVLTLTMIKEAYDDFNRFKRDKEANSQLYKVFTGAAGKINTPSSDLKVGDIIEVNANQRIPADLLLLYTSDEAGTVFIRTDQLDGETDWKLRKPSKYTQKLVEDGEEIFGVNARITAEPPRAHIYDFIGKVEAEVSRGPIYKESLSLENTMWANTVLTSGVAFAMVLYTGQETRMSMNSRESRSKIGNLDNELNRISKYLFGFMLVLSGVIMSLRGFDTTWYLQYFKYMLLLSSIIPISMRVNLDISKTVFSSKINNDKSIEGTLARNSTIPEELGRVQFLLTDKTGTLTQNEMIFKKLCLEGVQYDENNLFDMERILKRQCNNTFGPAQDIAEKLRQEAEQEPSSADGRRKRMRRDKAVVLRDLITALCVCHNVTPVMEDGKKVYQASSPDEVALVQIAESIKMKLLQRTQTKMTIENAAGFQENYKILANFPFTSESKRMGIILKNEETDRIIFYLKGADVIMKDKLPAYQRAFVLDEVEELAKMGLRTLVITQKYLTEREYQEWNLRYQEANNQMVNRDQQVTRVVESLETDMEFLGVTGVEDKLQEDVNSTIESLRDAGINVWMLTGDKIETAYCIAISAGFKSNQQGYHIMKEMDDPLEIHNQLTDFDKRAANNVLFIDGTTLIHVFQNDKNYFFGVACKAPAVVCCRVSPTQKALITEAIKEIQKKTVCCIGDGGNDVGMIQSADVGVGIVGKEGKQAALAADYSILKFKYIKTLLLWHGRNAYKRTAVMAQFVIHRGLTISVIQALFTTVFYYVAIPIYNGYLMLGYATAYTNIPVLGLVFDSDVDKKVAEAYPPLYKTLQKGRDLSIKTFLIWIWKSIYQGGVIILLTIALFKDSFLNIVTITFTALIIAELLNVHSETHNKRNITLYLCQAGTLATYALSVVFMKSYIDVASITNYTFLVKVVILTLASWIPVQLVKWLIEKYDPSEAARIMTRARILQEQSILEHDGIRISNYQNTSR